MLEKRARAAARVVSQAEISHGLRRAMTGLTESPLSTRIYCALPIVPLTCGCRAADISPRVLEVVQHPAPNRAPRKQDCHCHSSPKNWGQNGHLSVKVVTELHAAAIIAHSSYVVPDTNICRF
jgi:hypothetical protein